MTYLVLVLGAFTSLYIHGWLPIVTALVITTIIQETMLYDLHRHVLHLEDQNG